MAQISLEEAATRSGVPRSTLEAWAEQCLLTLDVRPRPSAPPPDHVGVLRGEEFVDEDELDRVVESLGWLHVSAQGWEETEEG